MAKSNDGSRPYVLPLRASFNASELEALRPVMAKLMEGSPGAASNLTSAMWSLLDPSGVEELRESFRTDHASPRVVVTPAVASPGVLELPWEALEVESEDDPPNPILERDQVDFVRLVEHRGGNRRERPARGLRVLIVVGELDQPGDAYAGTASHATEVRAIRDALLLSDLVECCRVAVHAGLSRTQLDVFEPLVYSTKEDLREHFDGPWDIVHFIGHTKKGGPEGALPETAVGLSLPQDASSKARSSSTG
ncbi:MAG: hypothetical protein R3F34_17475 [Planctomycetota bacterium]